MLALLCAGSAAAEGPSGEEIARRINARPRPEQGSGVEHLHRTPSQIAELAKQTGAKRLVLSHHMRRALDDLMASLELMRSIYAGPIDVAEDLHCYPLGAPATPAE